MPNPTGYSASQIWLHWLVAVLIVPQFVMHDAMKDAWRALSRGQEFTQSWTIQLHVIVGVAILALVIWRLILRFMRGAPLPPAEEAASLKLIGKLAHWLLYAVLAALIVSGGAAWFGGIKTSADVHEVLTSALLVLVGLHVLGALYHQFVLKNNLIGRMKTPN